METEIYNISVSPNGDLLALSSSSGVQVYRLANGKIIYTFEQEAENQFKGIYSYIAWSPDSHELAVGKPNIGVRIWDALSWKLLTDTGAGAPTTELPGFAWSPDGGKLALGIGNGEIMIWDKNENSWTAEANCEQPQVGLTWNAGGQLLIFSHFGLYDAETCNHIDSSTIGTDAGYGYAVWSPDKQHVYIFFDLGGSVTGITNYDPKFSSCCYSEVAWSLDGRYFAATPEESNEISVWDTINNRIIVEKKQGDAIYAFAWTPKGELLAAGSINGKLMLWNTNTGKVLLELR
jgi:WD40 repeat protein